MEGPGQNIVQVPVKTEPVQQDSVIVRAIVYGNTAKYFGFRREDGHTHEWKLYVRSYAEGVDLSPFIRKVVFVLDPYYANKEVTEPPYEVQHTGWGEFDLEIKIVFRIRAMRTLTLNHYLRLVEYINHDTGDFIYTNLVRSEHYDEIVFTRPPEKLRTALQFSQGPLMDATEAERPERKTDVETSGGRRSVKAAEHALKKTISLQNIHNARQRVKREIELVKQLIPRYQDEIHQLRARISARNPSE